MVSDSHLLVSWLLGMVVFMMGSRWLHLGLRWLWVVVAVSSPLWSQLTLGGRDWALSCCGFWLIWLVTICGLLCEGFVLKGIFGF